MSGYSLTRPRCRRRWGILLGAELAELELALECGTTDTTVRERLVTDRPQLADDSEAWRAARYLQ